MNGTVVLRNMRTGRIHRPAPSVRVQLLSACFQYLTGSATVRTLTPGEAVLRRGTILIAESES